MNQSLFAGEWVAEWKVKGATKEEYQKFAKAQLDVYGRATFGWAYWALKNVNNHWSLEWMIKNGYIKLQFRIKVVIVLPIYFFFFYLKINTSIK